MSPRQRRGLLLIAVAIAGAAGVYWALSRYVADVQSQIGNPVPVLVADTDIPAYTTPTEEHLVMGEVPASWFPPNSFSAPDQIGGRVTAAAIPQGTVLSEGMFLERPAIGPGEREIAVLVDAEIGVGGKLTSGAIVDIFATFGGDQEGSTPSSRIVVQRAQIIEVGSPVDAPAEGPAAGSVGFSSSQQLPITFRLSVEDAQTITYVESFANSIRLALRSPLDDEILDDDVTVFEPGPDDLGRTFDPVPPDNAPPADAPSDASPDGDEPGDEPDEATETPTDPGTPTPDDTATTPDGATETPTTSDQSSPTPAPPGTASPDPAPDATVNSGGGP